MLHPQTILQASQHHSTSRLQISLPETWTSFYSKPKPSFFKKKNIEKSTSSGRTRNELLKTLITARVRKKRIKIIYHLLLEKKANVHVLF